MHVEISFRDKIKIFNSVVFVVLGLIMAYRYWMNPTTPAILFMGLLFVLFGVYRLRLVREAMKKNETGDFSGVEPPRRGGKH